MIKRSISWFKFKRQMSTISTKTQRNRTAERSPDWNTIEVNFRFTRGRFVRNEAFEMSQRYIRFDMNELSRIAAEAVVPNPVRKLKSTRMECSIKPSSSQ